MRVLRAADYKRMPWKNGGGETSEIAVFPDGADIANFGWRISMARVASDGPFSLFPGIDRTLLVLSGGVMALTIRGQALHRLGPHSPPLSFPADVPTHAVLSDGSITDLNVMTRRGAYQHHVERIAVDGQTLPFKRDHSERCVVAGVLCLDGLLHVRSSRGKADLGELDCCLFAEGLDAIQVNGRGEGAAIIVNRVV